MKKCPFCAGEIEEEAVKCTHCNETLIATGPGGRAAYAGPGRETSPACPDCGHPVPAGRGFCPRCGVIQVRPAQGGAMKCPRCRSGQVDRISATRKAVLIALLGIFAPAFKSTRSQYACKACGNKW